MMYIISKIIFYILMYNESGLLEQATNYPSLFKYLAQIPKFNTNGMFSNTKHKMEIIEYYKIHGRPKRMNLKNPTSYRDAIYADRLDVIINFKSKGHSFNGQKLINIAFETGNIEIAKYFLQLGYKFTEHLLTPKAMKNNCEFLKFTIENGYKVTGRNLESAIIRKNLEAVKIIHQFSNKSLEELWNENDRKERMYSPHRTVKISICDMAARTGNLEIIKYLKNNGCTGKSIMLVFAAMGNNLDCVKYLLDLWLKT